MYKEGVRGEKIDKLEKKLAWLRQLLSGNKKCRTTLILLTS